MSLEIDHIFCFCDSTLSEVQILESNGFVLTTGRKHQGQGTANRSVVFEANYLELIYLNSEAEALLNPLQMHLRANWKVTGASPFGIALRGDISAQDLSQFWNYNPPYNPTAIIKMHRFSKDRPEFPLLFVMPSSNDNFPTNVRFKDFLSHKSESTNITKIKIETPFPEWPLSIEIKGLNFEKKLNHRMELHINGDIPNIIQLNELLSLTKS